jgi:cell division protein FtsL
MEITMARDIKKNPTKTYKTSSYVHGNTVRKIQVAEPYSNDEKSIEQLEEERRLKRQQLKRIHRTNQLNFVYTVAVTAIVGVIFAVCYQYLNLQTEVKNNASLVSDLQAELTSLTTANDELEVEVNASIDYDAIYDTAVNELGMIYPEKNQVIRYDAGESEYVKQYQDVPSAK